MTKNLRAAFYMALLAIGCMLTNATAHAQSVYGSIFGTVTDKTGAVIPGATVTVTDESKGTVETVVTNGAGEYTVSHLVPDSYDLKVDAKGFKSFVSKGIVVLADTAPRQDVALEVSGAGSETITVDADSVPQLKTDRADVSTVFDSQQVDDLPIEGQNFANLQLLLPGAQLEGWSHAADENPQASRQIQIDGQAFGGVAYELDGTDNQDPILGIIVVNPSLDSVTEAKITTQNFDAELGKAVSAVITVQTKSGSNSFHGSAYDFRTGNANLARDPFTQAPGTIPAGLKNKFGGSVGGRIIKDRLFFFGAYEGQRQKVGVSGTDTVPSLLLTQSCLGEVTGPSGIAGCDFSQYLAKLSGTTGTIYDNSAAGGGTAFKGNVIPAAKVSQQFLNVLKLLEPYVKGPNTVPVSNLTNGDLTGLDSNYHASGTGLFNSNLWVTRIDDTINTKMNAFVRFSRWTDVLSGGQFFGAAGGPGFGLGGYGGSSTSADDSLAIGTDYVFNPKLITDLRLGYLRYNIIDVKNDQSVEEATALGIPGINLGTTDTGGSPGFFIATLNGGSQQPLYGDGLNVARCNCPLTEREDQFQIVNNWTKTWGNHTVKFGADLRYGRNLRVPSDNDRAGLLNFATGPTSSGGTDGLGFATFALGDVTSFNRYVSSSTNAKEFQKRIFFYGADSWRASNKLTLNLGVRWELYYPESVNGPGNGALMDLNTGYLHVAGIGGVPSDMGWKLDMKKQFEPRIGVAYQLDPKTVIRAGYGRSFDIGVFGSIFGHVVTQNLPVLANQSISNSQNSTTGHAFCLGSPADNPGCETSGINEGQGQPAGGGPVAYSPVTVPSDGLLPNPGSQVNSKARPNPLQFPTLDAWNLSVQRALTPSLSVTLTYVGNKGTHTLSDGDGNGTDPNEPGINLPASFGPNGQALHWDPRASAAPDSTGATSNANYLERYYFGKLAACSDPAYSQPGGLPAGSCGWNQGVSYYGDNQDTHFNALQVQLAQAAWKGLSLNANYQYAGAFDYASSYRTWSKQYTYGRDSAVRNHSATVYGSYQMPFGKGKQFLNTSNRAANLLVGGYELSSTLNLSSGLPFTATINCQFQYLDPSTGKTLELSDFPTIPGRNSAPCYPNVHGTMKTGTSGFISNGPGTGTGYTTFFAAQTLGTTFTDPGLDNIGNGGRDNYYGPKFFNTDMSLQKTFDIWEKVQTKFRFDAYNAVNHINSGTPQGNVLSLGKITGEAPGPGPRQLEFALRVQF